MPVTTPICHRQVYIVLGSPHAPDHVMKRVIFFGRKRVLIRNGAWCQANGVREIEQCGSTYQVCPLACQHAQRLWKKHIVACCQANASRRSVKCRQSEISWFGPQAVVRCKMYLAV